MPRREKQDKQKVVSAPASASPAVVVNNPILHEIPRPIASLDISDTKHIHRGYNKTIKDIREAMKNSGKVFTFKDHDGVVRCSVPLTAGPDNTEDGAYVIELTDGKSRLRLVATKYRTWFKGIVTNNDERFEIDIDQASTPKMMAGSKSLHTTTVYCKLLGDNKTVANCKIGMKSLKESFKALVEHRDESTKKEEKKALVEHRVSHNMYYRTAIAVLLVMFFEAPRFVPVYETCLRLLKEKRDEFVGEDARVLINGWSDACRDFFNENGDQMTVTLSEETSDAVKKVADNVRILCWSLVRTGCQAQGKQ